LSIGGSGSRESRPTRGVASIVASFGEWPYGVVRLGVAICVVLAAVLAVPAVMDALDGSDHWADRNSDLTYGSRSVPYETAVGSQKVVEDARLWMPEDARYRIVGAPDLDGPLKWAAPDFLVGFLLPRRQTESPDANWVFCFRCDVSTLGAGFEVLSDDGNGTLFGRIRE
jgi:hypothetical protein